MNKADTRAELIDPKLTQSGWRVVEDHLTEVQQMADQFIMYYHNNRPHMALDMQTPLAFTESHLR